MSYRKFQDRSGNRWEVRPRSRGEWEMQPAPGNPEAGRTVNPPLYANDPFELSEQELQGILESGRATESGSRKAPWESGDSPPDEPDRPPLFRD